MNNMARLKPSQQYQQDINTIFENNDMSCADFVNYINENLTTKECANIWIECLITKFCIRLEEDVAYLGSHYGYKLTRCNADKVIKIIKTYNELEK